MSAVPVINALQVQAWKKKMIKEVISSVLWSSLSNRVNETSALPNGGKKAVPDSVVQWVTDKFTKGIQKTTVPFLAKLNLMGQGGWQTVEGQEETPQMRFKTINYNIQRKALAVTDESVEGDLTDYYAIASQKVQLLTDYFSELTDYNFQRAMLRGADEFLTEQEYWNGNTLTAPPVATSFHPHFFVNGQSSQVTWNANEATYGGNINTAVNTMNAANTFNLAAADSIVFQKDYSGGIKLQKLGWKSGDNSVQAVAMLSERQGQQLSTGTGVGSWKELMSEAGKRGVDNRAISGVLGTYKRILWLTDERAPIWNSAAAAPDDYIQFHKIADERAPAAHTGSGVGTVEMCRVSGQGAIGAAQIKDLNFTYKKFDYGFSEGVAAHQATGCERMDLTNTAISAKPLNQSSFVYCTSTPANAI